jgi:hypothetical protein
LPVSGELPEEVRTLRLLELGVSLSEIDQAPAVLLDELLALDRIRKEAENADGGGVDS